MATKPKTVTTHPCACSEVVRSCGMPTRNNFAPGHDAKLVSIAIRAAVAGSSDELIAGSWLDKVACSDADVHDRINATEQAIRGKVGAALAAKFDRGAGNAVAAATSKAAKAAARRDAKAARGKERADALMAKLGSTPDPVADDPTHPEHASEAAINGAIAAGAMAGLIAAVREHAQANYDSGEGWDVVVESHSDDDLAEIIGRARTAKTAIARVKKEVGAYEAHRRDIVNA